jgi:hypothetical protein
MAAAYRGDTFRAMARAICVALVCGLVAPAIGSPHSDPTAGRTVFTGATMPGATSIDLNPAALGVGTADELYLAAMVVLDRRSISTRTDDLASGTRSIGPTVRAVDASPGGMFAYILHVKDRGTLAFAMRTAPSEVFPAERDALRYHTLGGGQRTYGGTVAAQVRLADALLFGVSLAVQTSSLKLHYARDTALAAGRDPTRGVDSDCDGAPCGVGNPQATERYDIDVNSSLFSSDAITVNLGLVIQLAKETWLGVAYHTPPGLALENELTGSMTVTRAPRDGGGTVLGGATVYVSQPASVDAELRSRLVQQLDLHVGMRWEDLSRFQAYDVRGYGSALLGIPEWTERPRGFHDVLGLWAGVEQVDAGELLRFGGRLGFETSAVPDDRTSPLTIAPTSLTADVGAQFRIDYSALFWKALVLQASYGFQYFPTVNVTNSAFDPRDQLACMDSGYDYSTAACGSVRNGYAIPTAAGDYGRMEHAFRVGLRFEIP